MDIRTNQHKCRPNFIHIYGITYHSKITIPYKFEPRIYQKELLAALDSGYKRAIAVYHRRAGKDKTMFNAMVKKSLQRKCS